VFPGWPGSCVAGEATTSPCGSQAGASNRPVQDWTGPIVTVNVQRLKSVTAVFRLIGAIRFCTREMKIRRLNISSPWAATRLYRP